MGFNSTTTTAISNAATNSPPAAVRPTDALLTYLQLDDKIASVHALQTGGERSLLVLVGTFAGRVYVWLPATGGSHPSALSHFVTSATAADCQLLHRHSDEVSTVHLGPAGRRAASAGLDGQLLVSDVQTGMLLLRAQHSAAWCSMAWPTAAAFADVLLLGDDRGAISVWNMRTGERQAVEERTFGGGKLNGDDRQKQRAAGLVSALTTFVAGGGNKEPKQDDDDEDLFVVAAGVGYQRDFAVKLFKVVKGN